MAVACWVVFPSQKTTSGMAFRKAMQVQPGITEILIGQLAQALHGFIHRSLPVLEGFQ
jgi:hypothetical protein